MKRILASLIAGVLLGTAGIAGASGSSTSSKNFYANGVWCKSGAGGVMCVTLDGSRYGVGISNSVVMVYDSSSHRAVFTRAN